jgi:hypothetical protein
MSDETPVAALFDDCDVPSFLEAQPWWWHCGLYGFRLELDDPAEPTLWVFSRGAKKAFEVWQRTQGRDTDGARARGRVEP